MIYDIISSPKGQDDCQAFAETLRHANSIIAYHHTTDCFLDQILIRGIRTRSETGNSVYAGERVRSNGLPSESHPDKVYLTTRSGARWASRRATQKYKGNAVFLRVLLSVTPLLVEDEDTQEDPNWVPTYFDLVEYGNLSRIAENHPELARKWYEGMAKGEVFAHLGAIGPEHILGWGRRQKPYGYIDFDYTTVRNDPVGTTALIGDAQEVSKLRLPSRKSLLQEILERVKIRTPARPLLLPQQL